MLRNKEIRCLLAALTVITLIAASLGFLISPAAGIVVLAFAAASGTAYYVFTKKRYKRLADIAGEIDLVLHDAEHIYISEAQEGELSILQDELVKMTSRLRDQNAVIKREKENLSDSLADVAHQLRTPLTSLTLLLSLLAKSTDETERMALIREAEELLARMDWLITALLRLSRLDAGIVSFRMENIHIAALLQAAVRPFQIPAELHNIALRVDAQGDAVMQGDALWLTEAVSNILKNCMESVGDNGSIEICCTDNALFSEITVHDSGSGFAKDELPRLFQRFYRGKNSQTAGFGIGLSLSRTIVMRMGGTLTAKNHPQGGALFIIRFPK